MRTSLTRAGTMLMRPSFSWPMPINKPSSPVYARSSSSSFGFLVIQTISILLIPKFISFMADIRFLLCSIVGQKNKANNSKVLYHLFYVKSDSKTIGEIKNEGSHSKNQSSTGVFCRKT